MRVSNLRGYRKTVLILLLAAGALSSVSAAGENSELSVDGNPAAHKKTALIVSPLFGWVKNESRTTGVSDISPEQGLFVMYATPRIVIRDITGSCGWRKRTYPSDSQTSETPADAGRKDTFHCSPIG